MRLRKTFRKNHGKTFYGYETVNDDNRIGFGLYPVEIKRVLTDGHTRFKVSYNLETHEVLQESLFLNKKEAFKKVECINSSRIFKCLILSHINENFSNIILNSENGEHARTGMRMIVERIQNELEEEKDPRKICCR